MKTPSRVLSGPPQLLPAGGWGSAEEGGGARNTGPGPPAPCFQTQSDYPQDQGPPPAPPNTFGRGDPRHASPLPRRLKQRSPGARLGRAQAAPRKRRAAGARTAGERAGPAWRSPRSAGLPGVRGVPVDGVAEAGAPPQARAEQRGPEDSPQQGQQPHRPWAPVWSGPASPGPASPSRRERYKSGGGGGGGGETERRWGAETLRPHPWITFHQWELVPASPPWANSC